MATTPATTTPEKPSGQVNMGRWLNLAWTLIFEDIGFYLICTLIYLLVIAIASGTIIGEAIVTGPLTVGFFYILLQKMRKQTTQLGDLSKGFNVFAAAVISNILITIFAAIGFIFCILPGIVIYALYMFAPLYILEEKKDFWEAMEASRKLVMENIFELSIFMFLMIILNLIGVIFCIVGLLVTVPLTFAATAFAYHDLVGIKEKSQI